MPERTPTSDRSPRQGSEGRTPAKVGRILRVTLRFPAKRDIEERSEPRGFGSMAQEAVP